MKSVLNFFKKIIRKSSLGAAIFLPFFNKKNILQIEKYAQIGKISSGLIHDLSSPITALNIQMEMLSQDVEETEYIRNMKQTVSKIFDYSKLMKAYLNGSEKKFEINLGDEIQKSIELISYNALKNGVQIIFIRESEIYITANPVQIYQIMISLISNAIESFTPENQNRKIIVKLEKFRRKILISVQDFGVGIKNTKIIFETFYTTKIDLGGTGIGLSNVKRIIEKELKGKIKVRSKVGSGSTFQIILNS